MRRFYALFSLLPALAVVSPAPSYAQLVSITIAPPVLPVYVQPPIPAPGYIWTPGYWAYGVDGYYWVPGTWVMPPAVGLLWTPGYWGWNSGVYAWNAGYWGPTIGFYGGVNYGFGYTGVGFAGGYWAGGVFNYNRTVNNFGNVNITNVYNKTVIVNNNRVAFNGGAGGLTARPNAGEMAAMREQHTAATSIQTQHEHTAGTMRENLASVNHGSPTIAATSRVGEFHGAGVVGAHGGGGAGAAGAAAAGVAAGALGAHALGNRGAGAGAGGLAHGPGSIPNNALSNRNTGGLGNAGEPKTPGNASLNPNQQPGAAAPNRELRQANTGANRINNPNLGNNGNNVGNNVMRGGGGQNPGAGAMRPQAPPRAMMMAPPRGPQGGGAPRGPGAGGGRGNAGHRPG